MKYRYLIAALLLVLLVADVGWKAWETRPYVVTGFDRTFVGNNVFERIHYRVPGGGVGTVLYPASPAGAKCTDKAAVGYSLPVECRGATLLFGH